MQEKHTYKIIIDAQEMIVSYEPNYITRFLAHFEFHSPFNPPKRIPVSDTGYYSHFAYVEELKHFSSIEEYVYRVSQAMIEQKFNADSNDGEDSQMTLF